MFERFNSNINTKTKINNLDCQKSFLKNLIQEIYKRTILPLYIPIICIIASLIILKSSNSDNFKSFKTKVFLSGIFIIILSQVSINTVSINILTGIATLCVPLILFILTYFYFKGSIKNSS